MVIKGGREGGREVDICNRNFRAAWSLNCLSILMIPIASAIASSGLFVVL